MPVLNSKNDVTHQSLNNSLIYCNDTHGQDRHYLYEKLTALVGYGKKAGEKKGIALIGLGLFL